MPPSSRSSSTSRRAPDAPPDLWGPLRQIPEQDWARIRDLACPRNLDNVDDTVIAEFLAGYSAKLRASVHGCLPYLGDDVMPIELLAFHQGLKEAVKRLPEDFIQDHELDGIIWPLDAFESTDPPCLSRAEAKSLQRPMPVPYAVSRAEATPAPTPVVSRRPPPVASSPVDKPCIGHRPVSRVFRVFWTIKGPPAGAIQNDHTDLALLGFPYSQYV
ncbi:hypothetical protein C8R47DRAFT_1229630 [Mycena vitilis]|nr:hypothetical protein C8R47DRAFT_1229630 [Mycena vitilis]